LPVRLNTFVNDAYERGVLRRNGPVLQFRHALIQDYLTGIVRVQQLLDNVERGGENAGYELLNVYRDSGDLDAAIALARSMTGRPFRRTSSTGWGTSPRSQVARLLRDRSDVEGLQTLAADGNSEAKFQLADLLAERGDIDGLRALADQPDAWSDVTSRLAWLL